MRIAILNWRDIRNPKAGGAEIVTHEYAKRWIKEGHSVVVVCPTFPNSQKREIIDGVVYQRLGTRTSRNYLLIHFLSFFYYQTYLKGKVDLVVDQIHWIPFFTPIFVKERKIAFIHEIARDIWQKQFGVVLGTIGKLVESCLFIPYRNTPFITVSDSTKRGLKRFGIPEKNITVIHNGIKTKPLSKLPEKEKIPTFIYVGRIAPVKNLEDTISALKIIKDKLGKTQLEIVGRIDDRGYYDKLIKLVGEYSLKEDIKFRGYVGEEEKLRLLRKSHVFMHSSVVEGWGLVIIEANAMGTPAVAYNVAGLSESITHEKTGIICGKNDSQNIAQNVLELYKNKGKYLKMQKECLLWAKRFTWKRSLNKSIQILNNQ